MALAYKISDVISLSNDFVEKFSVLQNVNDYDKLVMYEGKLDVDYNFTILQPMTRWWNNQNRIDIMNFLEEEITTYFNFLTFVRGAHNSVKTSSTEREQLFDIYDKHMNLIKYYELGLGSLIVTYDVDTEINDKIKKMIDQMNYIPKIN